MSFDTKNRIDAKIKYGPKGIWDVSFFDFLIKLGVTQINANTDEKNKTKGIEIHPNQNQLQQVILHLQVPCPLCF